MNVNEDILFLTSSEISTYPFVRDERTPSRTSSSSSSSVHNMEDNSNSSSDNGMAGNLHPFSSNFLDSGTAELQRNLDMDFLDTEALDAFEDLQREEQRLREEVIFKDSIDINDLLQGGVPTESCNPFGIMEISDSPGGVNSEMVLLHSDNSNLSSTNSFDTDLNILQVCGTQPFLQHNNPSSSSSSCGDVNFVPSPSPSMDSPPLTPPEIKVDISSVDVKPSIVAGNGPDILSLSNLSGIDLPKLLPVLKSSKRGRSASQDDTPDVQALKRHIRMIRNRESASLSRKKKKEYLTGLENRVKELEKENHVLKKENQLLRSKLGQSGIKVGPLTSSGSNIDKKKPNVSVLAKVALLGVFGFLMVNFNVPSKTSHPLEHSNLSEFSRTFSKLELSDKYFKEDNDIVPIISRAKRLASEEPYNASFTTTNSTFADSVLDADGVSSHSNFTLKNDGVESPTMISVVGNHSETTWPTSYINGTSFNQTHNYSKSSNISFSSKPTNAAPENKRKSSSSKWRSRASRTKKGPMSSWSLKSSSLVFPPFSWSSGARNTSSANAHQDARCQNYFNKTESLRVKHDLEDIFGKGRFTSHKKKQNPILRGEPIVYSLINHNRNRALPMGESKKAPPVDTSNNGLTVYEGEANKYSSILEKLERREDTFYVVSLASENQLLLSAKASNESSRPKMTLLLPWRNETLKEDMILQIDCEVFQVFNLNDKKRVKMHRG